MKRLEKLPLANKPAARAVPRAPQIPVGAQKEWDVGTMLIVVYPIGDMTDRRVNSDSIIARLTTTVAPDTWDCVGGRGSIAAYPNRAALVVSNTSKVQKKIADALAKLRTAGKRPRGKSEQPALAGGPDSSAIGAP